MGIPHRIDIKGDGGAVVMLKPASDGTGVIAGGACRLVLEAAGVQNIFAKQFGSPNQLNNARAVIQGLRNLKVPRAVAEARGLSLEELWGTREGDDAIPTYQTMKAQRAAMLQEFEENFAGVTIQ